MTELNKESRKKLYTQAMSQQTELGNETVIVDSGSTNNEEILSNKSEIVSIIKKASREKILIRIKSKEGKTLDNNRILKFSENSFLITNPFILFAEGIFPDEVLLSFEDDGIDYSFQVKKTTLNGAQKHIVCNLPNQIKVLKRRTTHRVKATKLIPVGIFWVENEHEFIGVVNDISDLGIGIKFDACYFDFEFYNLLKNTPNKIVPIIFNIDNEHYPIGITVKYINKNEYDDIIIGAEFSFVENEQQSKIKSFVQRLKKEAIFEKNKQLTLHLIKTAEMEA